MERKEFLEQAGRVLTEALQDEILSEGLLKSGELARSPRYTVTEVSGELQLNAFIEDYGFFQDSGVNGTQRSVQKNSESFNPPGQFRSQVIGGPLPFGVRVSIAREGFKPRPFINKAFDRADKWISENIVINEEELIDNDIINIFATNGAVVS